MREGGREGGRGGGGRGEGEGGGRGEGEGEGGKANEKGVNGKGERMMKRTYHSQTNHYFQTCTMTTL